MDDLDRVIDDYSKGKLNLISLFDVVVSLVTNANVERAMAGLLRADKDRILDGFGDFLKTCPQDLDGVSTLSEMEKIGIRALREWFDRNRRDRPGQ